MIRAIIIDDEIRARRVLRNLIQENCDEVEIIAECADLPSGVQKINQLNPDVVFCDIEMPNFSGLEILTFFNEINFEIIFATGYSDYAINAFEMSAVDYILKPIQTDKLEKAVEKLKIRLNQSNMQSRLEVLQENMKTDNIHKIALPISDGLVFINICDLTLLEADGSYTMVWLKDGTNFLVSKKIKFFDVLLSDRGEFYRIHRSYLININTIKVYNKSSSYITLDIDKSIKIARDKKPHFEEYISRIKL